MLRAPFRRGHESQELLFVHRRVGQRGDGNDLGAAFGDRAGLVQHHRVDVPGHLERLRVADQDPVPRTEAGADHDRGRRRQPEGARAGDDEHGHRVQDRERERRVRPEHPPADERQQRDPDDDRHEDRRDAVRQPLDRRLRALRVLDEPDDARQR